MGQKEKAPCAPHNETQSGTHTHAPSLGHVPPPRPLFAAKHLRMLKGEGHSLSEASIQIQHVVWKSLFSVVTFYVQVKKHLLLF